MFKTNTKSLFHKGTEVQTARLTSKVENSNLLNNSLKSKVMRITLFFIILFSMNLMAQEKCKPAKRFKDDFAGVSIPLYGGKLNYSKSFLFGNAMTSYLYVYKQNGKTKLGLDLVVVENQSLNNSKHSFNKGDDIQIRTADGVLKLQIDEVSTSQINSSTKILRTYSIINFIGLDDLKKLTTNNILAYKVLTSEGGIIQEKIKESRATKVRAQFNCFYSLSQESGSKDLFNSNSLDGQAIDINSRDRKVLINLGFGFSPSFGYEQVTNILGAGLEIPIKEKMSIEGFMGVNEDIFYSYFIYGATLGYDFLVQENFTISGAGGLAFISGNSSINGEESETNLILKGVLRYYFSDGFSIYSSAGLGQNKFSLGFSLGL